MIKKNQATDGTLDKIKKMSPKLTEKQQYVFFGVLMGMMCDSGKMKHEKMEV